MEQSCISAVLYTDGASKGNPGPAGAGFVLYDLDGKLIGEGSIPLGVATNNAAEYRALIAGLHEASSHGIQHLTVRMDSELITRQLSGRYRVKSEVIRPLFQWVQKLIQRFESVEVKHVPRAQNAEADARASAAAQRVKNGADE